MNRRDLWFYLLNGVLIGCAMLLSGWVSMPWYGVAAAGFAGVASMLADLARRRGQASWVRRMFLLACVSSVAVVAAVVLGARAHAFTLDIYFAVPAGLLSVTLLWSARRAGAASCFGWKILGIIWAFASAGIWLFSSHVGNVPILFYAGLVIEVILLIYLKILFRLPMLAVQAVNTVILLCLGLPAADLLFRSTHRPHVEFDREKGYYSYETWKNDAGGFASWVDWNTRSWRTLSRDFYMLDPAGVLPWRLRPGAEGELWGAPASINSRGFRGREIADPKGAVYRIVAIGESTTFGITATPGDRPWTEFLEEMIAERLKPERPVEVINAGVPGYTLKDNIYRLPIDILPLDPDLILSYHGLNGFYLLNDALPPLRGPLPPAYRQRPLQLLAAAEYRLKIMLYTRRQTWNLSIRPPTFSKPMETEYARAYRELTEICRTNGIGLVLANYSMAVNDRSGLDVIDFYRATGAPAVHWQVRANAAHSLIVSNIAAQNPQVGFVNTHPGLDGEHGKFIDVAHFTCQGHQELAEAMFAAIRDRLEIALGRETAAPSSNRTTSARMDNPSGVTR